MIITIKNKKKCCKAKVVKSMASGCKNSGALSSCRLDCNKLTRTATISAKLSTSELHVRTERNEISACRQSWLNAAQKKKQQ